MPPHLLTNFEIQKYYQNEPKFCGIYSRNNLSKIKDGAYIINLDEYESIGGTHQIPVYVNAESLTYFDSFEVEHIPKEFRKFIVSENIMINTYGIQAYDSIMCRYFCIGFIDFKLKGKNLLEYTNLFSPNEHKKNVKIILKYFQKNPNKLTYLVMFAINIENLKKLKYYMFF